MFYQCYPEAYGFPISLLWKNKLGCKFMMVMDTHMSSDSTDSAADILHQEALNIENPIVGG